MKQIKIFLILLLIIVTSIGVVSCQKEDIDKDTPSFRHAVIVLMPWADNLTAAFLPITIKNDYQNANIHFFPLRISFITTSRKRLFGVHCFFTPFFLAKV